MARKTAADMVGLTLYARKRLPLLRWPEDNSPVIGYIDAGRRIGVVRSWIDRRSQGNEFWYWEFDNTNQQSLGTVYVPHDPRLLNLPQLEEDYEIRLNEQRLSRLEWWERAIESGGRVIKNASSNLFSGVMIIGGAYVLAKILKK